MACSRRAEAVDLDFLPLNVRPPVFEKFGGDCGFLPVVPPSKTSSCASNSTPIFISIFISRSPEESHVDEFRKNFQ
jgi:hypothetical protein